MTDKKVIAFTQIKRLNNVVDKLEQRIATLEKVLGSHAKTIGEIREELREILRVYHYNAINGFATCGTLNMSADVVTRLENLLGKTLKGEEKQCPTPK